MTIDAETYRTTGVGDDVTTTFPYTFEIADESEIDVWIVNDSTGARTLQTLTTHYSVTGVGVSSGGNIEFVSPPSSGETVLMARDVPFTQGIHFSSNGPLSQNNYTSLEAAIDRLQTQIQELRWKTERCISIPDNNTILDAEVTDTAVAANRIPSINASVNGVELVDVSSLLDTVSWINSMTEYTTVDLGTDSIVVWDTSESEHRRLALGDLQIALALDGFEVNTSGIADNAVTNTKMANMAADTIKGRANGAGTGDPQDLTATQVRAILNVEDGATADQTAGEIESIVNHDNLVGFVADEHIDWTNASDDLSTTGTGTFYDTLEVTHDGSDPTINWARVRIWDTVIGSGSPTQYIDLICNAITGNRTFLFPDADGTVLTDQSTDTVQNKTFNTSNTFNGMYPGADDTHDIGTSSLGYRNLYVGNIFASGFMTITGTINSRDISADGNKLDNIEDNADVTDAENVETSLEGITYIGVTPASGDKFLIIDQTDGGLKSVDYDDLPGVGSGAPSDATYIVQTANGTLTNEQALGSLATGILKNTTTTGVLSIATEGTDYTAPGGTDVVVADGGTGRSTATAYAVLCGGTTSTGAHQSVASVGTSGQVLTSNGAGALPTFQDASGGGGLILIGTATASSSASIAFTGLSSSYSMYILIGSNIQPSADSTHLYLRYSTNNGSSYVASGNTYRWNAQTAATGSFSGVGSGSANEIVLGFNSGVGWGNAADEEGTLILEIVQPAGTHKKDVTWRTGKERNDNTWVHDTGGGRFNTDTAVNAIQLTFSSGNIATGNFYLYGVTAS